MLDVVTDQTTLALWERDHSAGADALSDFHPAVAEWFRRRFPDGPTEPQTGGWPLISSGRDTLIAAPTGSGKTLAGFLVAIDSLYRAHEAGADVDSGARVVYVSPLKALAVDIAENLERPLEEIAAMAREIGMAPPNIRVSVRTGDTTASQRAALVRRPPAFVVTTPESLYLLLTSGAGRQALRTVETVIVDEIHAVARDKRGAHLALSLERLEALCDRRPVAGRPVGYPTAYRGGRPATGRCPSVARHGRRRPPAGPRPGPRAARRRARSGGIWPSRSATCSTASPDWLPITAPRLSSSTPAGWRNAWPTSWVRGSATTWWPLTTGACPRSDASGSRPGFGPAICAPWWRRRPWSWASTSDRWNWSARSGRRAASPPSFSASADPTTAGPAPPRAASFPSPATSWSSAAPC